MGIYKLPKNQWTKDGRKYKYYWNEKDKKWLINSVKRHNNDKKRVREIIQYVKDNGGIEYTQQMMKKYSQEALDILYEFPENEYRNSLETMVKYVMEREK